jgi:Cdc6-like AAA superfamily ATPase
METMQSWFGLKAEHQDFSIETDADAKQFFARQELDEDLMAKLRRSFRTGNPPKLVLYGDWGWGKTHTLRHMEYKISTSADFPAIVVFVELPDITAKSTFQVAHSALLDALGLKRVQEWVLLYRTRHSENAFELIRVFTQSDDIARAFENLLSPGAGSQIAWDWLRGISVSAGDARLAGLSPGLSQSTHFVKVLQMFGRLARDVEEKVLVFMLDEAAKLDFVSNPDAVNHWLNAFKLLADQQTKEVGFIVSGSWTDVNDMALPLQDPQVAGRFGDPNYVLLRPLDEEDTETFVISLLQEWIDPTRREEIIAASVDQADGEEVTDKTFPFTKPGLELTVQYACRQGGYTTPRDIQVTLDNLLNHAIDDGRHIVSASYLRPVVGG